MKSVQNYIDKVLFISQNTQARFFLLVDLREFFFRFRVGGVRKKINKKALKMTSWLVIFRAFYAPKGTLGGI